MRRFAEVDWTLKALDAVELMMILVCFVASVGTGYPSTSTVAPAFTRRSPPASTDSAPLKITVAPVVIATIPPFTLNVGQSTKVLTLKVTPDEVLQSV